jgi:hypothetical protein
MHIREVTSISGTNLGAQLMMLQDFGAKPEELGGNAS